MPETGTNETTDGKHDNRIKPERRSDAERRVIEIEYLKSDRRGTTSENRRSWIGRRQVSDWRKK
ncbi:MAG: hypothetical protein HQ494_08300 [Rhodospirillales bacterium]|nr:hypothetical protein [Rhodospirillales bacterium]